MAMLVSSSFDFDRRTQAIRSEERHRSKRATTPVGTRVDGIMIRKQFATPMLVEWRTREYAGLLLVDAGTAAPIQRAVQLPRFNEH
jgi:hypothetical protein